MKQCFVCKKPLPPKKQRFCGSVCYKNHVSERDKRKWDLIRKQIPKRPCIICEDVFQPVRLNNVSCCKICGGIHAKNKQQEKRVKRKTLIKVAPLGKRKPVDIPIDITKCKHLTSAKFNPKDTTKPAVLEYLKKGNTILKFPDEPRAKIPAVSVRFGHNIETSMGFGYEYENEEQEDLKRLATDI